VIGILVFIRLLAWQLST